MANRPILSALQAKKTLAAKPREGSDWSDDYLQCALVPSGSNYQRCENPENGGEDTTLCCEVPYMPDPRNPRATCSRECPIETDIVDQPHAAETRRSKQDEVFALAGQWLAEIFGAPHDDILGLQAGLCESIAGGAFVDRERVGSTAKLLRQPDQCGMQHPRACALIGIQILVA